MTILLNNQQDCDSSSEDEESIIPTKNRVKRVAVIDGCNVIHECATLGLHGSSGDLLSQATEKEDRKPSAIGLMLLIKHLLDKGFDVHVFLLPYYTSEKNVDNFFIIEQFEKLGFLTVVNHSVDDDQAILEYATKWHGFIVSNDQYRDYKFKCQAHLAAAIKRVIKFSFKQQGLKQIGGKEGMSKLVNKYFFGIALEMKLDPAICYSHIERDTEFLMVYSQRRLRSKCRRLMILGRISIIADYLQREYCFIHGIEAPHLPYLPHQKNPPPAKFSTFLDYSKKYLKRGNNIFKI